MKIIFFAFSFLAFSSCTKIDTEHASSEPLAVSDFRGKTVSLSQPAQRIVCLLESALSGLYMLRVENRIAGVPTNVYSGELFDAYAAMDDRIRKKTLPAPGNWDFVNLESVIALQPDLVIIWRDQREAITFFERHGIAVYAVFITKFSDIEKEIADLSILTSSVQRSDSLISFVRGELSALQQITGSALQKPRTYFMWSQGPLETSGKNSTVEELFLTAGAENISNAENEHLTVHMEDLLRLNPEVIIQWNPVHPDARNLEKKDGWRAMSAVQNNRVHMLPSPFLCDFWTFKYLLASRQTAAWCHPALFTHEQILSEQNRVLSALYGRPFKKKS